MCVFTLGDSPTLTATIQDVQDEKPSSKEEIQANQTLSYFRMFWIVNCVAMFYLFLFPDMVLEHDAMKAQLPSMCPQTSEMYVVTIESP